MASSETHVRFDWAIKNILRDKANFAILEGFLSELLGEDITIDSILESESNQAEKDQKYNRVDLKCLDSQGQFIIIEVQNSYEIDYFQRSLFGASKVIVEHLKVSENYKKVKKVISVNILYFNLGVGEDYVYHGKTEFKGIHRDELLQLTTKQKETFNLTDVADIFPEYYILRVKKLDDQQVKDPLDEWIYFLKNSAIKKSFSAKGLKEAEAKLQVLNMSEAEQKNYRAHIQQLRDEASEAFNAQILTEVYEDYEETKQELELRLQELDNSLKQLDQKDKELIKSQKELEESQKELEESQKELEESQKELKESQKELEQKEKELESSQKKLEQKNTELSLLKENYHIMAKKLLELGIEIEQIIELTGLTEEEIKDLK